MAILAREMSRVVVQGITGSLGRDFARRMIEDGTRLVGGVTPGRGGETVLGVDVFDSVQDAVRASGATASLVVVPPAAVADAVGEAVAAGIELVSVYTENVPVHDSLRVLETARAHGTRVIGPNAAGIASPGIANLSDILSSSLRSGPVGIVSKSGTLTYEVIDGLRRLGLGVSTVACLGGDPVVGTSFREMLPLFAADPATEVVVLLGEIGGTAEFDAAWVWNELGRPKPLVAYVAGWAAPPGKRMGHAGAIIGDRDESAQAKLAALREVGAVALETIASVASAAADATELVRTRSEADPLELSRGSS